MDKTRKLGTN